MSVFVLFGLNISAILFPWSRELTIPTSCLYFLFSFRIMHATFDPNLQCRVVFLFFVMLPNCCFVIAKFFFRIPQTLIIPSPTVQEQCWCSLPSQQTITGLDAHSIAREAFGIKNQVLAPFLVGYHKPNEWESSEKSKWGLLVRSSEMANVFI